MRRLILRSFQSPGDIVMLTAAVRDLHRAYPGRFETDVRTSAQDLWEGNPLITSLREVDRGVECFDMQYPLIHQSNQRPHHFLHGFIQYLERRLSLTIPVTDFRGDIYLTDAEKRWGDLQEQFNLPERYWIVVAGGKYDFTAKWWNPASYQRVVDHFRCALNFVQCGEAGHWHPPLDGVQNLVGQTRLRDLLRLVYFAEGVLCPVTLAMHLAAAVERPPNWPALRPCVVVAGGREPAHWEAYPGHQFLHTVGTLDCCATGACWRSRCQTVGDGDAKDRCNTCEKPVRVSEDLSIPQCMEMISSTDVIAAIERYQIESPTSAPSRNRGIAVTPRIPIPPMPSLCNANHAEQARFLIDCRQAELDRRALEVVLRHLHHYYPSHDVDVLVNQNDSSAVDCQGGRLLVAGSDAVTHQGYRQVFQMDWRPCEYEPPQFLNTPATRCLLEDFHLTPIPDLLLTSSVPFKDAPPMPYTTIQPSDNNPSAVVTKKAGRNRKTTPLSVRFYHGLGDCAFFSHLIPLYLRRGYEIQVECTADKRLLFEAAGAKVIGTGGRDDHPWAYPGEDLRPVHGRFWQGSKPAHNLSQSPLPSIGSQGELWKEYCEERIDIRTHLAAKALKTAERWLSGLPRPVVLLHTKANTSQARKSLPDRTTLDFYRALLDRMEGSIILLDWDNRVPRVNSWRVRHLDDLGDCPTEVLMALMTQADLLIGVDSGPLHVARFTGIPTVGVWMPGHYPARYSLPRHEQLNVVLAEPTAQWNRFKRIPWNIVEHSGNTFEASQLATICARMLGTAYYLDWNDIAADIQLQQFVGQYCRGRTGQGLSDDVDRHRSFDRLLKETTRRFPDPTIVETGTIRAAEDWNGAGFFTYLAGTYLFRRGAGRLHSVDTNPQSCRFAREETAVFGSVVQTHQSDSVRFLKQFTEPIDVLVLDSLDTTEAGHAEHALREIQAAANRLHEQSLVVFDDTPWSRGRWVGKGALAVPWLLERGWKLLYAGYQVILEMNPASTGS